MLSLCGRPAITFEKPKTVNRQVAIFDQEKSQWEMVLFPSFDRHYSTPLSMFLQRVLRESSPI
jgi:hypothetical protein